MSLCYLYYEVFHDIDFLCFQIWFQGRDRLHLLFAWFSDHAGDSRPDWPRLVRLEQSDRLPASTYPIWSPLAAITVWNARTIEEVEYVQHPPLVIPQLTQIMSSGLQIIYVTHFIIYKRKIMLPFRRYSRQRHSANRYNHTLTNQQVK